MRINIHNQPDPFVAFLCCLKIAKLALGTDTVYRQS